MFGLINELWAFKVLNFHFWFFALNYLFRLQQRSGRPIAFGSVADLRGEGVMGEWLLFPVRDSYLIEFALYNSMGVCKTCISCVAFLMLIM